MAVDKQYLSDAEMILSHRYDNGADYWTTPDKRLLKGSPFSAYNSALLLLELGLEPTDSILKEVSELFFSTWKEDGRFKLYPKGSIYPCHTAPAAYLLCRMGYASDMRIQKPSGIYWIPNILTAAGVVTNFPMDVARKQNIQTPGRHLPPLMRFDSAITRAKNRRWTRPWNFYLHTGQSESRLATATMV